MMKLYQKIANKKYIIMNKLILTIISFFALIVHSNAQNIIPVEDVVDYEQEIPDGTYIKDVNHLLDKYEGNWVGSFENKNYQIIITKENREFLDLTEDLLLLKYKITNDEGEVIENTLEMSDDEVYVIEGSLLYFANQDNEQYHMNYVGENSNCGQSGTIYLMPTDNSTQLKFSLVPENVLVDANECPEDVEQLFPTESSIIITKEE